jgi:hypothetical protein
LSSVEACSQKRTWQVMPRFITFSTAGTRSRSPDTSVTSSLPGVIRSYEQPVLPLSVATAHRTRASHVARRTMHPCRSHYPGGPRRVRVSVASAADTSLPRNSGGSASTSSLSRPAQDSLALRPVRLLISQMETLSPQLRRRGRPRRRAGSYRVEPTITRVDLSSTGPPRLRGALNSPG